MSEDERRRRCRLANLRPCQPHTYPKLLGRHAHRRAAELALGRPLTRDEIVHHRNGDKHDYSLGNLEVMTRAEHYREHLPQLIAARYERQEARRQAKIALGRAEALSRSDTRGPRAPVFEAEAECPF